jgi:protein TonB
VDAIRFHDDPWPRLPWLAPVGLLLTLVSLAGFLQVLERSPAMPRVPGPISVEVLELPPPPPAPPPVPRRPPPPVARPRESPPPPKPAEKTPSPPAERPESASPVTAVARAESEPKPSAEPSLPSAPPLAGPPSQGLVTPPAPSAARPATLPAPEGPVASLPPAGRGPSGPGGTDKLAARAVYKPLPEIPEALRRRSIEVVAMARFRVGADGDAEVELVESTADPDLNRALLESLRRWRFFPAMQDGKPVASTIDIRIPISVR